MNLPTLLLALAAGGDDLLIADFEGRDYGAWKLTGRAFGSGPARGTLANQMHVEGFQGKGLVNSYFEGDASMGTLTSLPFTVERPFINFLIGGGRHPGETCLNLLVDGKPVRTATGEDAERLEWQSWDVTEFAGKPAMIEIVDRHAGGWGHINVDQIVQSEKPLRTAALSREILVESRYLHLPVRTGASKRRMRILQGETLVREFEIEVAGEEPSFWAFVDVGAWKGKTLRLEVQAPAGMLDVVAQGDALRGVDAPYREKHRPGFHFTSRRGWLNDPNGLVYHQGEWHLYYQHNPYGWNWGNMHWGHAVSRDLLHWEELPIAVYPRRFGDWAFSGSAVVDAANTSGFKTGAEDVLVAAYTSTGRGECILYSNDRGRTWTEFEGNPVVKHGGRDPKLLWHAPTKRWVMAVYNEDEKKRRIAFHSSPDLKTWTFHSFIDGYYECPDLFELPVTGDPAKSRWVLYGADGKYALGAFDGRTFIPDGDKHTLWYGNFYAAQTYSDAPGGRRVQIGWAQGVAFPGMPFNQQMNVPVELSLRNTDEGPRLFAWPVRELDGLRGPVRTWKDLALKPGANPLPEIEMELADLSAELRLGEARRLGFIVRGVPVVVDVAKGQLSCNGKTAPLGLSGGTIRLRILVDRGSIEVFSGDGRTVLSAATLPPPADRSLRAFAEGGEAQIVSLELAELSSTLK